MKKRLVAYFSASGVTKKTAEMVAEAAGADLYEITPKVPYTKADLNWMDKKARSTVEMNDKKFRPELGGDEIDMSVYDEILVGFPIWWYVGKKIILFATSGGSGFGNTVSELQPSAPNAQIVEGKLLNRMRKQEISEWVKTL